MLHVTKCLTSRSYVTICMNLLRFRRQSHNVIIGIMFCWIVVNVNGNFNVVVLGLVDWAGCDEWYMYLMLHCLNIT